ncbi:MAG: L-seryl-tRNA(Sec) selenium transferase [Rhodospirillaceae bacterium]|nr:L-seryl-tRNA(Sec) selenium transferase [Rhodospirillaceae bacterium]|tara:strand:- start:460 stop:1848 length:1389 start_codon:yes stop_codon:yes gene_type:complete
MSEELFKRLPAIDKWLNSEIGTTLIAEFSRNEVSEVMRQHLIEVRDGIDNGLDELPDFYSPQYAALIRVDILRRRLPSFCKVINATGIIIHTNLGRAPLAEEAIEAISRVARGYSNLEMDLSSGQRGSRYRHVESLLCQLTGSEAALVVNNCAAAVILSLSTLAAHREVIVSRGELVEIGGSFRIPDIIKKSECRMVEVGTTNKTRISDYASALSSDSRVLLSVHPSNYKIIGFSEKATSRELADLSHQNELIFMQDLGSGTLVDMCASDSIAEQSVKKSIADGADIVTFSGDKLLGGPQSGIILGRSTLIDAIKNNPLLRGFRIDKLSLAALVATLRLYIPPNNPAERVPVLRMINEDVRIIDRRARNLLRQLKKIPGLSGSVVSDVSYGGGGVLPMTEIPTKVLHIEFANLGAGQLARILRESDPPLVARVNKGKLIIDPRTILSEDTNDVVRAFRQIVR